jgi:hypothetical protein
MPEQTHEPGPGRSTSEAAFNALKNDVAQRNARAHAEAHALRSEADRRKATERRERENRVP